MIALPEDVALTLLRGLGAYLRATPAPELPASVRRYKGFRDSGLAPHRDQILRLLDDDTQRALVVQWLDEDKVPLAKDVRELLDIAARRADGWEEALNERSRQPQAAPKTRSDPKLAEGIEREKDKTRRAREELRRFKEDADAEIRSERARSEASQQEISGLESQLKVLQEELDSLRSSRESDRDRADREVRRARSEVDKVKDKLTAQSDELKSLRKELAAAHARIAELEKDSASKKRKKPGDATAVAEPRGPRGPLKVPKGRFEDAPETLEAWLATPDVQVVVDGYNVTKAEGGFGDLSLEDQRDRLIKEVNKLARRFEVTGRIVFDGNEVAPGTTRTYRGPVKVLYSRPDEIADDAIIDLLGAMPPIPVILVTNDRELQDRARTLGATIATSTQLLKLLR